MACGLMSLMNKESMRVDRSMPIKIAIKHSAMIITEKLNGDSLTHSFVIGHCAMSFKHRFYFKCNKIIARNELLKLESSIAKTGCIQSGCKMKCTGVKLARMISLNE